MDTPPPASPTPVTAEEPLVYRPISMLAIASVVAAGLFTALIVFIAVVSLFFGSPIYLTPWWLALAALGVVLAVTAGWRIRSAEGTLAGQKLANWGWWLSIVAGLGYAAFYGATALAVTQQADNFLRVEGPDSGFFPLLQKGQINRAFLLTQRYSARADVKDDDQLAQQFDIPVGKSPKGLLSMFRTNDIVRTIVAAGDQAQIKPMGVQEWEYANKGFTIKRPYKITTPEVEMDVLMTAQSTEGDGGGAGRKWSIVFMPPPGKRSMHFTELGVLMTGYRQLARIAVQKWVEKLNTGHVSTHTQAYFDTCEPAARLGRMWVWAGGTDARLVGWPMAQLALAPGSGLPLGSLGQPAPYTDYDPWLYLPGYAEFTEGKGMDVTNWEKLTRDPELRQKLRSLLTGAFFGRGHSGRMPVELKSSEEAYTAFRKKDGKVQILCDYDMPVRLSAGDPNPKYVAECTVVAEAREEANADAVSTITLNDWRIVSVEVTHLFELPHIGLMKVDPTQPMPKRGGGQVR